MLNPKVVGRSNETDHYTERSISCAPSLSPAGVTRPRWRTVALEWQDPISGAAHMSRVAGIGAACMQLAIDELSGDAHCPR